MKNLNLRKVALSADNPLLLQAEGHFLVKGSHGVASTIVMETLVYSTSTSDYIGLPSSPSNYIYGLAPTDAIVYDVDNGTGNTTYLLQLEAAWSDGSISYEVSTPLSSSDPSVSWEADPALLSVEFNETLTSDVSVNWSTWFTGPGCDAYSASEWYFTFPFKLHFGAENIWYGQPQVLDPVHNICGFTRVANCSQADGFYCGSTTTTGACSDSGGVFLSRLEISSYVELQLSGSNKVHGACVRLKSFSGSESGPQACSAVPPHLQ